jgi:hypothetical protein
MITPRSRTKEWIEEIRGGLDPGLVEKMILAFTLVETLCESGCEFIFKGGTSLPLVTGKLNRFSIDIDIVTRPGQDIEPFLQYIIEQNVFTAFEEDKRDGDLPVAHYKLFYPSIYIKEGYVLLDVLYENLRYEKTMITGIASPLLNLDGEPTSIRCPNPECLLGDKLTAFAPHTTGIQFNRKKELELTKQLFDISILFDFIEDIELVFRTYKLCSKVELGYRHLNKITPLDAARDTFETSCMIGMYDQMGKDKKHTEYNELVSGVTKLRGLVYSGYFSLDVAILCASKAAYISALFIANKLTITRYRQEMESDILPWTINIPEYNKLNKLKKLNVGAFYYFYQALYVLGLL